MQQPETRTFEDARQIAEQFETVLRSYDITIAQGSELEAAVFEMSDLEDRRVGRSAVVLGEDSRASLSRTLGVLHFAELIVSAHAGGRKLHTIVPHLRLLNRGSVAQNVRRIGDEASNKLFEALIGLACMTFATEVQLDDPDHSKGDNPDVMFRFEREKWALACKVPNGESMLTAVENVENAVAQIERSCASRGIVVLNARNWIDHNAIWRRPGGTVMGAPEENDIHWAWSTQDAPLKLLREEADRRRKAIAGPELPSLAEVLKSCRKTVPVVLVFLQSATLVASCRGPMMTRLGMLSAWQFAKNIPPSATSLLEALNEAMLRPRPIPDLQPPPGAAPH